MKKLDILLICYIVNREEGIFRAKLTWLQQLAALEVILMLYAI